MAVCFLSTSIASALPDGIVVEQYVDGLLFPVSMTPTPDGDLLVTEKLGTVRLVQNGRVLETPVAQVEPVVKNEAGLLGIALLPDFETSREFVITYTPAADLEAIYVSKFRLEQDGTGTTVADPWLVLPSREDTDRHYGGNVRFHGDKMYVALSDLDYVHLAQERDVLAGSILRYNLDLTIPDDNPWPDSPIYALGMRNTFDFDIASDGTIWGAENGHHQHDEVNRIVSGGNYGFPIVLGYCDQYPITEPCDESTAHMIEPMYEFKYRTGPTGALVYEGDLMPELKGNIFVGGWHTGELHRMVLSDDGERLSESAEAFFIPPEGVYAAYEGDDRAHLQAFGIVDAVEANDGAILVLLSGATLGKVYRITPRDAVLDESMIREEGTSRAFIDAPVCASSSLQRPAALPWLALVVGLLGAAAWRRRKAALAASVVAVACLSFAMPAQAQEFRFGGKAGADLSFLSGDNTLFMSERYGAAAGATARYRPFAYMAVSADLLYALKGASHNYFDSRSAFHYLSVPLLAEGMYTFGPVTPRIYAGGVGSLLVAATSGDNEVSEGLNRLDWGLTGGVGVDVDTDIGTLTFDGRYERSLRTIYDDDATPDRLSTPTNFHNVIYVLVGYLY